MHVEPLTAGRYNQAVSDFTQWLGSNACGSLPDFAAHDIHTVNIVLQAYVQFLCNTQRPLSQARNTLAGFQFFFPPFKGNLGVAWSALKEWSLQVPHETHTPMGESVVRAAAVTCFTVGWPATGALLLLGHHCLLRPAEIHGLHRTHLHLPCDSPSGQTTAIVSIVRPKVRNRGRMLEAVVIQWEALVLFLDTLFGWLPGATLLCSGGSSGLTKRFRHVLYLMHLEGGPFTLASLRAGGAVDFYKATGNIAALQYRGRWDAPGTLGHYLQEAMGILAFSKLNANAMQTLSALSPLLEDMMTRFAAG